MSKTHKILAYVDRARDASAKEAQNAQLPEGVVQLQADLQTK